MYFDYFLIKFVAKNIGKLHNLVTLQVDKIDLNLPIISFRGKM